MLVVDEDGPSFRDTSFDPPGTGLVIYEPVTGRATHQATFAIISQGTATRGKRYHNGPRH